MVFHSSLRTLFVVVANYQPRLLLDSYNHSSRMKPKLAQTLLFYDYYLTACVTLHEK